MGRSVFLDRFIEIDARPRGVDEPVRKALGGLDGSLFLIGHTLQNVTQFRFQASPMPRRALTKALLGLFRQSYESECSPHWLPSCKDAIKRYH